MNESILAVDDNERLLKSLTFLLGREGFRVITATNGRDAQRLLASERPSLVLLDMTLPDVSGAALLKDIRRVSGVPVIVLSALVEVERSVGKAAAVQFVAKPFDPAELIAKVKQALRSA